MGLGGANRPKNVARARKLDPKDEEVAAMERPKGVSAASGFRRYRGSCGGHYYQGAPFGAPSPLIVEGREPKAQLARRRENEAAWLFEI